MFLKRKEYLIIVITVNLLQVIAENCSNLKSITLAHCSKVNAEGIKILLEAYTLESVDFSFMSVSVSPLSCCIECYLANLHSV